MAKASKELQKRNEVPEELTWDLEAIFATDEEWEEALEQLRSDIPEVEKYQGKLSDSAQTLYDLLQLQDQLSERLGKLFTYAHMRSDQDTTNSFYQALNTKAENLLTVASSSMSYIVPEILEMDEETIKGFLEEKEELQFYKKTLDEINRQRPHVLSKREEALLAEASDPMSTPAQTFGMLNNADLTFPTIKNDKGEDVDLTQGRYIGFLESENRDVRKEAFKAMYNTYGDFINTFSSTLTGNLKTNNFNAKIRNYSSAREAALNDNHIPEQVYDNLVEAVNEKLPLLHRYAKLRKQVLDLDELHMYDMYTPLVKDVDMKIPYEKAQQYVLESLAPLGEEYVNIVKEGYENRWIDVEENKGKRSGAYSSGAYGTNPYILLNWQDSVNDTFTLAHELGHSVHSYYSRKAQAFRYGNYSIFVAEVASTTNEALLNDYLLKNLDDEKQKLYLLNHYLEGFRGTVFRQTMFAEFEHDIHKRMQDGEALTAEKLTEIYHDLNKKYFGDEVVSDEEIGLEWARIPHFYMNYYVYQYATGYSAATALANQILEGKEGAVDRYINFLKAGSSEYPIEILKKAGVDMTSKQPILDALDVFEEKLNEMEELLLK
ncbi:oligoendopeptidase F [Virgibacillus natechei]|uniref:Oligopeptidase F n=1 Tax=Virgibacillus natechei TaxID=1216297 RepID=A0ABS4IDN3_9BACI|nr:oligoendopeptidase F [Virgibacillus natechei]MBP1969046.1 oligoendopeptidase F [Virgibacillus natechei]UZD14318.1 oligoendopeptidase F [Virgibacillus natechei]